MTPEEKIFEKIRRVLLDDTAIKGIVGTSIYEAHISSIDKPKFPAISLHLINGSPSFSAPAMSDMTIQIDLWFDATKSTTEDMKACHRAVRAALHRGSLSDASKSLIVHGIYEMNIGPTLYEQDTRLHHLPTRYKVVAT
jgi:hypothetical protein